MNKRPELDTTNPPGQIVNPIPKQECEKLTFDAWLLQFVCDLEPDDAWWWKENGVDKHTHYSIYKRVWKAAQENK